MHLQILILFCHHFICKPRRVFASPIKLSFNYLLCWKLEFSSEYIYKHLWIWTMRIRPFSRSPSPSLLRFTPSCGGWQGSGAEKCLCNWPVLCELCPPSWPHTYAYLGHFLGGPTTSFCKNSIPSCQNFLLPGGAACVLPSGCTKLFCQAVLPVLQIILCVA